jgi:hypothetical protein
MDLPDWPVARISGIAAAILQASGFMVIATAVLRGESRPNRCSWLIWSLVASLAAAGSWQAGATWPLAGAVMNALGCIAILVLSWHTGRFVTNRLDLGCLAAACVGIAAWLATSSPVVGLALFLVADACGAAPTIRGVLRDPGCESVRGCALLAAAGLAAVLAVEPEQWAWSAAGFGHWGGAVYVALVNGLVAGSIVLARAVRPAPVAVS